MRAVRYDAFGAPPYVTDLPEPEPSRDGVVVRVEAAGLCRSRLARLAGPRPRHHRAAAHTRGTSSPGAWHEVGPDVRRVGGRRPGRRPLRLWLWRSAPGACPATPTSASGPVAARVHGARLLRRARGDPVGGRQRGRPAGRPAVRASPPASGAGSRPPTAACVDVARVGRRRDGGGLRVRRGRPGRRWMVARSRGARVVGDRVSESALALAADAGADVTVDASAGDSVEQVLAVAPGGVRRRRRRRRERGHRELGDAQPAHARPPSPDRPAAAGAGRVTARPSRCTPSSAANRWCWAAMGWPAAGYPRGYSRGHRRRPARPGAPRHPPDRAGRRAVAALVGLRRRGERSRGSRSSTRDGGGCGRG